jgi:hypothetical protein
MLITQSDITACGSLALTLRRWAVTCVDRFLEAWLAELEDFRFVLIDEDTEELLVRTFAKWDGGYKHSKRVLAVIASARSIRSARLKAAVVDELRALGVAIDMPSDRQSNPTAEAIESRRSVVTLVPTERTPHSGNLEREPPPSISDVEPSPFCARHPKGTEDPCGPCGTAKRRHVEWHKDSSRREDAEKAAAKERLRACAICDETGMVLDAAARPIRKCNHLGIA